MGRSVKKGPYVATHLDKKVMAINEGKSKKALSKHGAVVLPLLLILLDIHSLYTTGINLFLFI